MKNLLVSYRQLHELGITFKRAWLARLEARGEFPRRIRIGAGPRGRIAWRLDDILAWIEARADAAMG